jgi:menaquinone-dependent protoporphyrinogen oxidase
VDAALLPSGFSLDAYAAAVVTGSVHVGKHEKELATFVRDHRETLERMPAVFLSVSLSEAGAEDAHNTPEQREKAAADVQRMIHDFLVTTGWHPSKIRAAAGALTYSKYNFLVRFVMKRIAHSQGASTDTSRDHEYTDWEALDRLVDEVLPPGGSHAGS